MYASLSFLVSFFLSPSFLLLFHNFDYLGGECNRTGQKREREKERERDREGKKNGVKHIFR